MEVSLRLLNLAGEICTARRRGGDVREDGSSQRGQKKRK